MSAYVDEDVARRVEHAARVEARPVSQIASAALAFYARLPSEAHQALRAIEAFGGPEALDHVTRSVARRIVDAEYEFAERRVIDTIPDTIVAALDTEDDVLAAAVRLTTDTARATPALVASDPVRSRGPHRTRSKRAERG